MGAMIADLHVRWDEDYSSISMNTFVKVCLPPRNLNMRLYNMHARNSTLLSACTCT